MVPVSSDETAKGNSELPPEKIESFSAGVRELAKREKKSSGLRSSKVERRKWNEAERQLRFEESDRNNKLNRAVVYDLRKGVKLRNLLARFVTRMAVCQLLITNAAVLAMFGWQMFGKHQMPSDRVILGWLASTVVEVIGLYAVVLRGVFTPISLRGFSDRDNSQAV